MDSLTILRLHLHPHQVVKLHHDLEEQVHHNSQLMADNGARQVWQGARGSQRGWGGV